MTRSFSIANQIHRFDLAVAGAQNYRTEMLKESVALSTTLQVKAVQVRTLAAQQEKAKQDLALLTRQLGTATGEAAIIGAQIVRLAEVDFGPRHPRLREFRPATEGKATRRVFVRHTKPAPVLVAQVAK